MLTREQIASEIERLTSIQNLTNEDRIKLARLHICRRYIELVDEKNAAIDQERELSFSYDEKVLGLMLSILTHTRNNWDLETDVQRKGSLHNLVRTTLILRRAFTCIYNPDYPTQGERSEELNFWRNIRFLIQCQISEQGPGVNQRFPISFDEINSILREIFRLMDVLQDEIAFGLILEEVKRNLQSKGLEIGGYILD